MSSGHQSDYEDKGGMGVTHLGLAREPLPHAEEGRAIWEEHTTECGDAAATRRAEVRPRIKHVRTGEAREDAQGDNDSKDVLEQKRNRGLHNTFPLDRDVGGSRLIAHRDPAIHKALLNRNDFFLTWSIDDLILALIEAGGDATIATTRIIGSASPSPTKRTRNLQRIRDRLGFLFLLERGESHGGRGGHGGSPGRGGAAALVLTAMRTGLPPQRPKPELPIPRPGVATPSSTWGATSTANGSASTSPIVESQPILAARPIVGTPASKFSWTQITWLLSSASSSGSGLMFFFIAPPKSLLLLPFPKTRTLPPVPPVPLDPPREPTLSPAPAQETEPTTETKTGWEELTTVQNPLAG
ncbi:hypothetical protein BJV78DRAFT_1158608 [Lactifluus subvellereus]|nr:hypothetical protein BJV78DRAFT_1158608 [Lactifluus subvellereus]